MSIKDYFLESREYEEEDDMSQAEKDFEWQYLNKRATDEKIVYIDSLIHTSTLEHRQITAIEMEMQGINNKRADEIIRMLRLNQQLSDRDFLKRIQTWQNFL